MMSKVRPLLLLIGIAAAAMIAWGAYRSLATDAASLNEAERNRRLSHHRPRIDESFWSAGLPKDDTANDGQRHGSDDDKQTDVIGTAPLPVPINPRTRQPFTDEELLAFEPLRQKFPGNRMIPHRRSQAEIDETSIREAELDAIYASMDQGKASADEVNRYFDDISQSINDRIQILNYFQTEQKDAYPKAALEQMEELMKQNRSRLSENEVDRKNELTRIAAEKP